MNFPSPTEKQARLLWWSITALAIALVVAIIGLLIWVTGFVLGKLSPVLMPLAIAGIVACLLDPIVDYLQRRGIPRTRGILWVFFIAIMLVLMLLAAVVPRLVFETRELVEKIPGYTEQFQERMATWTPQSFWKRVVRRQHSVAVATNDVPQPRRIAGETDDPQRSPRKAAVEAKIGEKTLAWAARTLPEVGAWILNQVKRVASWFGLLVGLALVPVYTYYFLKEKNAIQAHWTHYLPLRESKLKNEAVFVISAINDCLIVFFRGQVLVAICSGTLLTIGFLILGLPYAVLVGVVAGVLGIVPYLGVMVSVIPVTLLAVAQFGDWWHPAIVLGIFAMVNMLEGLVISPRIIGDRVGLHPLTIIIAVMVGTALMGGVLGGLLAIPLTAALRAMMFRYVWVTRPAVTTA